MLRKFNFLTVLALISLMACNAPQTPQKPTPPITEAPPTEATPGQTDTTPPRILAQTPAADAVNVVARDPIALTFDEAIRPETINTQTLGLEVNGKAIATRVSLSQDGKTATLAPENHTDLGTEDAVLSAAIGEDITDLAGNKLERPTTMWSWQIASEQVGGHGLEAHDYLGKPLVDSKGNIWIAYARDMSPNGPPDGSSPRQKYFNFFVERFDGKNWTVMGDPAFGLLDNSNTRRISFILALDQEEVPVVAWNEYVMEYPDNGWSGKFIRNKLIIKRWNGSAWADISHRIEDSSDSTSVGISSMVFDSNNQPILVLNKSFYDAQGKYNHQFQIVSVRQGVIYESTSFGNYALSVDRSGIPVLAYKDAQQQVQLYKWNGFWSSLTNNSSNPGEFQVAEGGIELKFDKDNAPIVYTRKTIYRWVGTIWEVLNPDQPVDSWAITRSGEIVAMLNGISGIQRWNKDRWETWITDPPSSSRFILDYFDNPVFFASDTSSQSLYLLKSSAGKWERHTILSFAGSPYYVYLRDIIACRDSRLFIVWAGGADYRYSFIGGMFIYNR